MADFYKDDKPCALISKSDTINYNFSPSGLNQTSNNYVLNHLFNDNYYNPEYFVQFFIKKDGQQISYSNVTQNGGGWSISLSDGGTRWLNKSQFLRYMNDSYLWADLFPNSDYHSSWSKWDARVRNNITDGYLGGCSLYTSAITFNYTHMEWAENNTTYPINITHIYDHSSPMNIVHNPNGNDILLSATESFSFNLGYEAIISGAGLSNYIDNVTSLPVTNQFFLIGMKGGYDRNQCYNNGGTNNKMAKFYSFNEVNADFYLPFKKLRNDVYYITDKNFYNFTIDDSYAKYIITGVNKATYPNEDVYYNGSQYPDGSVYNFTDDINDPTIKVFNTYNDAYNVYTANCVAQHASNYYKNIAVSGSNQTYISQLISVTSTDQFNVEPTEAHYQLCSGTSPNTKYYAGPTAAYVTDRFTATNFQKGALFTSYAAALNIKNAIGDSNVNIVNQGAFASATHFIQMPAFKTLALNYYIG